MNVSLAPDIENIVQSMVDSGSYGSPRELIQKAVMLLKEQDEMRQQKFNELKSEVLKGYESIRKGNYSSKSVREIANEVRKAHQIES